MIFPQKYTVQCQRKDASWRVDVTELACTATVPRLADAEEAARRLVIAATDVRPESVEITLMFDVSVHVQGLIEAAGKARRNADRLSPETVARRRMLARHLAADGFPIADVAFLLGVSLVRAHQLIGRRHRSRGIPANTRADRTLVASPGRDVSRRTVHRMKVSDPAVAGVTAFAGVTARRPADGVRVRPHTSYKHEALFYRGHAEFLSRTVPFVQEGLAMGQPVMVAVIEPRLQSLRDALGEDAAAVRFVDMGRLGANPAQIIPAWQRFVDEHALAKQPMRGIGEPIWAGRQPEALLECQFHEALLNLAIDPDTPMWLSCPYDVDALSEDVVAEAQRSHPALMDDAGYRGSTSYGGLHHVNQIFHTGLAEPAQLPDRLVVEPNTVGNAREMVIRRAEECDLDRTRIQALATVMTEFAMNSIISSDGQCVMRVWQDDRALVCEVAGHSHCDDPLIGRVEPGDDAAARAAWLANELCDLTQIRSTPEGTVVRVLNWL